jgi:hypothetical protein
MVTAAQREEIQSRVTNHFSHAVMFKPEEAGLETPTHTQLAPLLVQAVAATNAAQLWADRPAPTTSSALVFAQTNPVVLGTNHYAQYSYVWHYPTAPEHNQAWQGVRLTVDSRGAPVIWEVLTDTTGADVIYVAQSLEGLARAEFGPPLPGRKFSVEAALTSTNTTVVANVIDDGPMPMGPILYLQPHTRDVTALICRCMPTQFTSLLDQADYQLQTTATERGEFSRIPLSQRLRLPREF